MVDPRIVSLVIRAVLYGRENRLCDGPRTRGGFSYQSEYLVPSSAFWSSSSRYHVHTPRLPSSIRALTFSRFDH